MSDRVFCADCGTEMYWVKDTGVVDKNWCPRCALGSLSKRLDRLDRQPSTALKEIHDIKVRLDDAESFINRLDEGQGGADLWVPATALAVANAYGAFCRAGADAETATRLVEIWLAHGQPMVAVSWI